MDHWSYCERFYIQFSNSTRKDCGYFSVLKETLCVCSEFWVGWHQSIWILSWSGFLCWLFGWCFLIMVSNIVSCQCHSNSTRYCPWLSTKTIFWLKLIQIRVYRCYGVNSFLAYYVFPQPAITFSLSAPSWDTPLFLPNLVSWWPTIFQPLHWWNFQPRPSLVKMRLLDFNLGS